MAVVAPAMAKGQLSILRLPGVPVARPQTPVAVRAVRGGPGVSAVGTAASQTMRLRPCLVALLFACPLWLARRRRTARGYPSPHRRVVRPWAPAPPAQACPPFLEPVQLQQQGPQLPLPRLPLPAQPLRLHGEPPHAMWRHRAAQPPRGWRRAIMAPCGLSCHGRAVIPGTRPTPTSQSCSRTRSGVGIATVGRVGSRLRCGLWAVDPCPRCTSVHPKQPRRLA